MAKSRDSWPRYVGESSARLSGDSAPCLPKDLQLTNHSVMDDLAGLELLPLHVVDVTLQSGYGIKHVANVDGLIPFAHRSPTLKRESDPGDTD